MASGAVDPARLARWRKLNAENKAKTPEARGPKGRRR
ncbi:hypothetical protein ABIE41_003310 [Bosea sp. OAE506]